MGNPKESLEALIAEQQQNWRFKGKSRIQQILEMLLANESVTLEEIVLLFPNTRSPELSARNKMSKLAPRLKVHGCCLETTRRNRSTSYRVVDSDS